MPQKIRVLFLITTSLFLPDVPPILHAKEIDPLPIAAEFTRRLGWIIEEVFNQADMPASIFPYRGDSPGEDNVVFYYSNSLYLFWFHNRVWQVRADEHWEGNIDGVEMGMTRQDVTGVWGPPINDRDEHPTWTLPDRGYPVRIRLYFSDKKVLNDLYVYRSDW